MKDDQDVYVDWMSKYGGFSKDMTLRDYFAAALVSSGHTFGPSRSLTPEQVAAQAYQMADAMLEARK